MNIKAVISTVCVSLACSPCEDAGAGVNANIYANPPHYDHDHRTAPCRVQPAPLHGQPSASNPEYQHMQPGPPRSGSFPLERAVCVEKRAIAWARPQAKRMLVSVQPVLRQLHGVGQHGGNGLCQGRNQEKLHRHQRTLPCWGAHSELSRGCRGLRTPPPHNDCPTTSVKMECPLNHVVGDKVQGGH